MEFLVCLCKTQSLNVLTFCMYTVVLVLDSLRYFAVLLFKYLCLFLLRLVYILNVKLAKIYFLKNAPSRFELQSKIGRN